MIVCEIFTIIGLKGQLEASQHINNLHIILQFNDYFLFWTVRDGASNARDRAENSVNEIERKIDQTSHQLQNKRQTLNNTKEKKNTKEV